MNTIKNKRYIAITGTGGHDELYSLSVSKEKQFEKLFGRFDDRWKNHSDVVDWLRANAKYIGKCTCVACE